MAQSETAFGDLGPVYIISYTKMTRLSKAKQNSEAKGGKKKKPR